MKSNPLIKIACLWFSLVSGFVLPTRGLIINTTFDTSVTSSPNSALIQSAFNTAAGYIQTLYTNDITINVTVYWGANGPFSGGIGLGASSWSYYQFDYPTVMGALQAAATTTADASAVTYLPSFDPSGGGIWGVENADCKALGLYLSPNDPGEDGAVGFADSVSYTFDPTNRAVAGKYDFIGVALHEITEVMGRSNAGLDSRGIYLPYDLFRYTGVGALSLQNNAAGVYLSIDGGTTALRYFWTNSSAGDVQDWLPSGAADSYDYAVSSGKKTVMSYADLVALDVIGYDLNYSSPLLQGGAVTGTNFVLNFTNPPGTTFAVLAATNLPATGWKTLGTCTDSVPGHFTFTDHGAGTNKIRFYQVRLN